MALVAVKVHICYRIYICMYTYVVHMHPGYTFFVSFSVGVISTKTMEEGSVITGETRKKQKKKTEEEETQYSPNTSGIGVVFTCMTGHCDCVSVRVCFCVC